MIIDLKNNLWQLIVDWLSDIPKGNQNMQAINNFDHMLRDLRPSDVILFEGVTLHQEGVPTSIIDKAAIDYGMPMGPLELADTVGLDIYLHVGKILAGIVGVKLPNTLDKEVENGRLGKKTGQGFYLWKKGKKVAETNKTWDEDKDNIQQRLINKLLDESKKCLQEGIVEDADLLDAGVIFGTGFAPFRGGPMHSVKHIDYAM